MLAPNVLAKSDKAAANDSEVADMLPDVNAEFVRNLSNSFALSLDIPKFLAKLFFQEVPEIGGYHEALR